MNLLRTRLLPAALAAIALATAASPAILAAQSAPAQPQDQAKEKPSDTLTPLPTGIKLFLKDGTFQLVKSYQVQGERVRYWSVERSAWEEIPEAMVDWDATHKGEAQASEQHKEIDEKIHELEQKQIAQEVDVDASMEIAPGVFLPPGEGLYVVEGEKIAAMTQALADSKLNKKRMLAQVIVPIPVVPSQHKVELAGAHAALRISSMQPEFYFRTTDQHEPSVVLVRAKVKGKVRAIGAVDSYMGEDFKTNLDVIALERWEAARGLYRFTLGQDLTAGEYAFVEFSQKEGMNMYVWDFGVDPGGPKAPAKK